MTRRRTFGLLLAAATVAVAAFNVTNLMEAYGSGPPYYSRTTNMDKWESPLPVLLSVDAIAMVAIAAFFFTGRARRRSNK